MPIQPNKNNLITYASLKGDRRSFTGNQRKDDYINKQLLTGEWGYDETTGGLSRLDSPIDVSQNAQTLGRSDYYSSGYNLNEEELTQSYIDGDNTSQRAKNSYLNAGHSAVVNNPAFKAAAFMTPPGMAIGAMEGAAHLIPDSYNFAQDPSWGNAGSVGMDLLMMAPTIPGAVKGIHKPFKDARKILKEVDGYANFENSYASSMLANSMDDVSPLSRRLVDRALKNADQHPVVNDYLRAEATNMNATNSPFSRWFDGSKNRNSREFLDTSPSLKGLDVPWSEFSSKGLYNSVAKKVEDTQRAWKGATASNNPLTRPFRGMLDFPQLGRNTHLPFRNPSNVSEYYQSLREYERLGGFNFKSHLKQAEARMKGDITGVDMTNGTGMSGVSRGQYIEESLREVKNLKPGGKFTESSISPDAFLLQQSKLSKSAKDFDITQGAGYMKPNELGYNASRKYWLKQRGKTMKDLKEQQTIREESARQYTEMGNKEGAAAFKQDLLAKEKLNLEANPWYKEYLAAEQNKEFFAVGTGNEAVNVPWHAGFTKDYVAKANKITSRQGKLMNQKLPETKLKDGTIYVPRMEMVKKGGSAQDLADRLRPVEEFKTNVQLRASKVGLAAYGAHEVVKDRSTPQDEVIENIEEVDVKSLTPFKNMLKMSKNKNNYKKGGWFQSSKAGRGVRDVGRLAVNSALNPIEGLIGTDFGFDEKYGYSNDWAKKASKVTEGIGTTIGGVANAYVNTIVPGSGAALNAVGSGMESGGITQAQDGVGAIGTDVGKAAGIFMGGEPPVMAKNGMKHSKYGKGGKVDLEAEGGEVVLTQGGSPNAVNDNASMTKIGEGAFKINGSSHNNGGVDIQMPSGESMIINKKDAPHAQKLIKLIGTAKDDSASNDFITKATGDLNSKKYTAELNAMVEAQQARNGNKSNSSVASEGTGWQDSNSQGDYENESAWSGPGTATRNQQFENQDGTISQFNFGLYGGQTDMRIFDSGYDQGRGVQTSTTPHWEEEQSVNLPGMEERMGLNPLDMRGGDVEDARIPDGASDYRRNLINNNQNRKSLMGRKDFQKQMNTAEHFGNKKDMRRLEKYGNTRSGLSNFFSNTFGGKYEDGGAYNKDEVERIGQTMNPNIFPEGQDKGYSPYTHVDYDTGDRSSYPGMNVESLKELTVGSPPPGGWSAGNALKTMARPWLKAVNQPPITSTTVDNPSADGLYYQNGGKYMKAQDGLRFNPYGDTASAGPYSDANSGNIHNMLGDTISNNFMQDGQVGGPNYRAEQGEYTPSEQFNAPPSLDQLHNNLYGSNAPTGRESQSLINLPRRGMSQMDTGENYMENASLPPRPPAPEAPRMSRLNKLKGFLGNMSGEGMKEGLGNVAPYASSLYNMGVGVAGLINPADDVNAEDYTTEKLKYSGDIDPYSQMAPSNQLSATYLNNESNPVRRQAFASTMAPKIAQQYGQVNYLNKQRKEEVDKGNAGIGKDNNQIRMAFKEYNDKLAAAPHQFLKEGMSQASNTSLALEGNELLEGMSGTANYNMGQYIEGMTPQERIQFAKLLKERG